MAKTTLLLVALFVAAHHRVSLLVQREVNGEEKLQVRDP